MANKVLGFGINTLCIKGIKSTYKTKVRSKGCRMREMTEYQEAEKEAKKEARRESNRTGAALGSESRAGATEGQAYHAQASSSLCFPRRAQPEEGQKRIQG